MTDSVGTEAVLGAELLTRVQKVIAGAGFRLWDALLTLKHEQETSRPHGYS